MHTVNVQYRGHIIEAVLDVYEEPYILMEAWVGIFPNQINIYEILNQSQIKDIVDLADLKISPKIK